MLPTILGLPEKNANEEVTVTINNPISLICEALAFPFPNITWMKDGLPFEASKNIQLLPGDALGGGGFEKTGELSLSWVDLSSCLGEALFGVTLAMTPQAGTHGLQILNAQKEDAGQYTCIVTNELGEATKNYHVEVLSKLLHLPPPPGTLARQKSATTLETPGLLPVVVFPESRRQLWRGNLPFPILALVGNKGIMLRLRTCCHTSLSPGFLLVWRYNLGSLSLTPRPSKGPSEATTETPCFITHLLALSDPK